MLRLSAAVTRNAWLPLFILALATGMILVTKNPLQQPSDSAQPAPTEFGPSIPPPKSVPGEDRPHHRSTKATPSGSTEPEAIPKTTSTSTTASTPKPPISAAGELTLREMMRQDFDGFEETEREDGSASLSLQGRFMHMSAVSVGPEGEPRMECFCSADHLIASTQRSAPDDPANPTARRPL